MNLITRDTDYAIRAICYIAKNKKRITSASALVRDLKIPRPFLRKILQKLNKKNILKSSRGKGGGFILKDRPQKILVADLIKVFQGPVKLQEHIFKKGLCPSIKICALKKRLDAIEKKVIKELRSITIASLLKDNRG